MNRKWFWNQSRPVRELTLLAAAFLFGLLVMPLLVYVVGIAMLGPYSVGDAGHATNGGFGAFWKDIFIGLGHGSLPVWAMVLGPWVLLTLLRGGLLVHKRYLRHTS